METGRKGEGRESNEYTGSFYSGLTWENKMEVKLKKRGRGEGTLDKKKIRAGKGKRVKGT